MQGTIVKTSLANGRHVAGGRIRVEGRSERYHFVESELVHLALADCLGITVDFDALGNDAYRVRPVRKPECAPAGQPERPDTPQAPKPSRKPYFAKMA
jgi:hypothetical protein